MVKERADHQRIYDNDGYKKRAACVCVKNENENEVLLISSSRNNENWIIPGGGIEDNENPEHAAEREVYEEAGVQGRLGRLLGVFEVYENKERKHRTSVYLLIVDRELDDWEEHKIMGRKRKWFNLEEAKAELEKHKPVQSSYLSLLKGYENIIWTNENIDKASCLSNNTNNNNNNNNNNNSNNSNNKNNQLNDNEYTNLSHSLASTLTTNLPYLNTHSSSTSSSTSTSSSSSYSSSPSLVQQPLNSSSSSSNLNANESTTKQTGFL